jgi:hypothetical protein
MSQAEEFERNGYLHLRHFLPEKVASAFLLQLREDLRRMGADPKRMEQQHNLLKNPALELYAYHYPPMLTFLWGMTPAISAIVGRKLLPTYGYFRIYKNGDICRVHSDRPSCEVSLSLTMAYGEGKTWPLEMGSEVLPGPQAGVTEDFGTEPHAAVPMAVGDGVLYQGVHRRHGRTMPNPNDWSAHLFLHWVDPNGPYADSQFDGRSVPEITHMRFA